MKFVQKNKNIVENLFGELTIMVMEEQWYNQYNIKQHMKKVLPNLMFQLLGNFTQNHKDIY